MLQRVGQILEESFERFFKNQNPTLILVSISWFSSRPMIDEAIESLEEELKSPNIIYSAESDFLKQEIIPFENGKFFDGETTYGPHTTLQFRIQKASKAFCASTIIRRVLSAKFPSSLGKGTGGVYVTYNNKSIDEILRELER